MNTLTRIGILLAIILVSLVVLTISAYMQQKKKAGLERKWLEARKERQEWFLEYSYLPTNCPDAERILGIEMKMYEKYIESFPGERNRSYEQRMSARLERFIRN